MILAASKKPEYAKLVDNAVAHGKKQSKDIDEQVEHTLDFLLVQFGKEILNIVPGKVSTEVDAAYSFDKQGSIDKALKIIDVCTKSSNSNFAEFSLTITTALQAGGHQQGPCPHQACLHLGGYPGRP